MAYATIPTPGDGNQEPLGLTSPKVVPIRQLGAVPRAQRWDLLASCPARYRPTLEAMIRLAFQTGVCFASLESLIAEVQLRAAAPVSRATVVRHRTELVKRGYLIPAGGGHWRRRAHYVIRTAEQRAVWLAGQAFEADRPEAAIPPGPLGDRLTQIQERFGL
jgi:hypothetical protein